MMEKETTEVEKIEQDNSRMEAALQKRKELAEASEALKSREALSGKAMMAPVQPKKEISPKDYASAALRGIILK